MSLLLVYVAILLQPLIKSSPIERNSFYSLHLFLPKLLSRDKTYFLQSTVFSFSSDYGINK